jgi:hypothetical protein
MRLYISPEHFQAAHYYFFIMAISSFTVAVLFYFDPFYSYVFFGFYVIHSAISWGIAWSLNKRVESVYFINSRRYVLWHLLSTVLFSTILIFCWYMFQMDFNIVMTYLFLANSFLIFLAMMWFLLGRFDAVRNIFEFHDSRKFRGLLKNFLDARADAGKILVKENKIKSYKYGSNANIEGLLVDLKELKGDKKRRNERLSIIKEIELGFWDMDMYEIRGKLSGLGMGSSDQNLINILKNDMEANRARRAEYERYFMRVL